MKCIEILICKKRYIYIYIYIMTIIDINIFIENQKNVKICRDPDR